MAPDTMRGKSRQPNPLAARLTKRAGCLAGNAAAIVGAVLGPLTSWLVIQETTHIRPGPIFPPYIIALILTFGGTLSLPIFVTYVAVNLTVGYARSLEYPALCTTSLPSKEIVKGYVLAALRYCRAPVLLMIGLTPAFALWFTPLLTPWVYFPSASYSPMIAQTASDTLGIVLKWSLIALSCGIGLLGINFMAIAFGVGFGLWWRSIAPAAAAALAVTIGTTLTVAFSAHRLATGLNIPDLFLQHILQYIFFVPCPYLIAFGCMQLARRWARKPG
ncbi:MAG: hypothetical protein ACK2US_15880 [Anaerolineae bacterium]|jgi:hypothetical protein